MPTAVYVAISSVSKTGSAVPGGGGATYAGTYATLSLAFANTTHGARNLVTLDQQAIYECYKDVSPLNDSFTINTGWTTTAGQNIIIRPALGEGHTGVPLTGFRIQKNLDYGAIINVGLGKHVLIEGMEVVNPRTNQAVAIFGNDKTIIDRCIVRGGSKVGSDTNCIGVDAFGDGCIVKNTLAYDSNRGFRNAYYATAIKFYNCVAIDCVNGIIARESATITWRNCVTTSCTTGFSKDATSTYSANTSHNASSDTTAPGSSSITNIVNADCFVNVSIFDLHLKAGSPLSGVGFNLASEGVTTDIDGQPWTVPYSIGVDQPGAFTVPIIVRGVPTGTEIRVYKVSDGSELIGVESSSTSNVTLDMPYPGAPVDTNIRILNLGYDFIQVPIQVGPNGVDFPISPRIDRWYSNPV